MKIFNEQVTKFRFLMLHGQPGPVRATSQKRTVLSFAADSQSECEAAACVDFGAGKR